MENSAYKSIQCNKTDVLCIGFIKKCSDCRHYFVVKIEVVVYTQDYTTYLTHLFIIDLMMISCFTQDYVV